MLAYGVDMDTFLYELKKCIQSIVVKQTQKATLYETAEIKRKADSYIAMMDGMTEWASFGNFDYEVLVAAGLSSSLINDAVTNKDLIPYDMRSICMNLQRQFVIDNYVEENDYYRMLNGLPSINDKDRDFIRLGPNSYGLPEDTPVHLMTLGQQDAIITSELLSELLAKYPTKKYLKFLGSRKISPYKARIALNYQIIYMEKANTAYISNDFTKFYASARDYVMRGLYNYDDRNLYNSYDEFMGFVILIMTVNRMFSAIFKQGISREFYDDGLIRDLFACYNIPYEESIDLKYQRELAKKLNLLLQKKSSNNVLFDIKSLFNYNQVNIYQYYLMKDYYHDDNGDPIIIYKRIIDEDGNEQRVVDYEKTYDIYFQKVNIASENKTVELTNPSNRVNYVSITGDDPYWTNDSDLINKLYTNSFNSLLTKYMSIDVAYDISKLMYETCHTFRLIFDAYEDTRNIKIKLPYVDDPVSLYDTVTFVCALVCKKFNLTGEIPLEPWNVANVYGFNFHADIEYLREAIVEDFENNHGEFLHVDPEVLSYLKIIKINTLEDVKRLYENMEGLRVFLDTAMRYTQDLDAYNAYKKIYNSILVTTDKEEVYKKNDGSYAHTYMELLSDRRPDLADVVRNTEEGVLMHDDTENAEVFITNSINGKLNHTLDVLSEISEELSDLRFASEKTEIVNNIEKVINQMKSYTVDMQSAGILYVFNDPHFCMLKILDYMKICGYLTPNKGIDMLIDDVIGMIKVSRKHSDKILSILDKDGDVDVAMTLKDLLKLIHELELKIQATVKTDTSIEDAISHISNELLLPMLKIYLQENYYIDAKFVAPDKINLNTTELWAITVDRIDHSNIGIYDAMSTSATIMMYMMALAMKDSVLLEIKSIYKDAINFINEIWSINKGTELGMTTEILDLIAYTKNTVYSDKEISTHQFAVIERLFTLEDYIWIRNELMLDKNIQAKMAMDLIDTIGIVAKEAVTQGIITSEEFEMDIDTIIPLYLKLLDKLSSHKESEYSTKEVLTDVMDLVHMSDMRSENIKLKARMGKIITILIPAYLTLVTKLYRMDVSALMNQNITSVDYIDQFVSAFVSDKNAMNVENYETFVDMRPVEKEHFVETTQMDKDADYENKTAVDDALEQVNKATYAEASFETVHKPKAKVTLNPKETIDHQHELANIYKDETYRSLANILDALSEANGKLEHRDYPILGDSDAMDKELARDKHVNFKYVNTKFDKDEDYQRNLGVDSTVDRLTSSNKFEEKKNLEDRVKGKVTLNPKQEIDYTHELTRLYKEALYNANAVISEGYDYKAMTRQESDIPVHDKMFNRKHLLIEPVIQTAHDTKTSKNTEVSGTLTKYDNALMATNFDFVHRLNDGTDAEKTFVDKEYFFSPKPLTTTTVKADKDVGYDAKLNQLDQADVKSRYDIAENNKLIDKDKLATKFTFRTDPLISAKTVFDKAEDINAKLNQTEQADINARVKVSHNIIDSEKHRTIMDKEYLMKTKPMVSDGSSLISKSRGVDDKLIHLDEANMVTKFNFIERIIEETTEFRKTLVFNDGITSRDSDYLSAISSLDTNNGLARAIASTRTDSSFVNDDILGVVYGLDGSVEVIGGNNTLEANANNISAPKGIRFRDSVVIARD